jgi:hypothetical protein
MGRACGSPGFWGRGKEPTERLVKSRGPGKCQVGDDTCSTPSGGSLTGVSMMHALDERKRDDLASLGWFDGAVVAAILFQPPGGAGAGDNGW